MKFKINRDHFSNGLSQVLNVVGSKATMPILGNVLIEADKDGVVLTTTNLDLGIRVKIKAVVTDVGSITLPVKRLASIIRELPQVEVYIESTSNHQVKLSCGAAAFKIMGLSKDDFPVLPDFSDEKSFVFTQSALLMMLKSVSYAQSTDETRYILNGVYFNFVDDKLTLVATDGRRLALISKELETVSNAPASIILPAKTVVELSRMLDKGDKVKISFNVRRAVFQIFTDKQDNGLIDSIYLYSKVVEGNYPNYQQVIPKETHQRIKLDRVNFVESINRAALVCSDKSNSVKLRLTCNNLEISAMSPDFGESNEIMPIAYSGPDLQVAFNPQFIIDPMRALDKDEVFLEFKDEVSPGVFKIDANFLCVVMPVRIT
jgi:DNA polymerase III subunit beta